MLADFTHGDVDAGQRGNCIVVELGHVDPNGKDFHVLRDGYAQFMTGVKHAVGQDVGFTEQGPGHPLFCIEFLRRFDST